MRLAAQARAEEQASRLNSDVRAVRRTAIGSRKRGFFGFFKRILNASPGLKKVIISERRPARCSALRCLADGAEGPSDGARRDGGYLLFFLALGVRFAISTPLFFGSSRNIGIVGTTQRPSKVEDFCGDFTGKLLIPSGDPGNGCDWRKAAHLGNARDSANSFIYWVCRVASFWERDLQRPVFHSRKSVKNHFFSVGVLGSPARIVLNSSFQSHISSPDSADCRG